MPINTMITAAEQMQERIDAKRIDAKRHSRYVNQMDAFMDAAATRFERGSLAVLNAEQKRVTAAFQDGGLGAALFATELSTGPWSDYLTRLWVITSPEAAEVAAPWLGGGKATRKDPVKEKVTLAARNRIRQLGPQKAAGMVATSKDMITTAITAAEPGAGARALLLALINAYSDKKTKRSRKIAYSEVHESANYGTMEAASGLYRALDKVWVSLMDGRQRDAHGAAHGQRRHLDQHFMVMGDRMNFPGDSSLGASLSNTINCFPADTVVMASGIQAAYKRWFEGYLIEIETSFGDKLAGTANHPILTARGWVPLHAIEKTDTVFRCNFGERVSPGCPDIEGMPTTIGDIYDAEKATSERVCASGVNFHGDIPDGKVNVVLFDGELRNRLDAALDEEFSELRLTFPNVHQSALAGDREPFGTLPRNGLAHGVVGGGYELLPLLGRHTGQPQNVGFGAVSSRHARVAQHALDNETGNAVAVCDREFRFPTDVGGNSVFVESVQRVLDPSESIGFGTRACGYPMQGKPALNGDNGNAEMGGKVSVRESRIIEAAQVVAIGRRYFHGHVFNLQTHTGMYAANNIVAHNCRCVVVYQSRNDRVR
jgi:hypothetical protein